MGWVFLFALIAASVAVAWLLGARGAMLQAVGAALLLGAAGYALQGHPDMAGAPTRGSGGEAVLPLTEARHAFYGNFSPEERWLALSEGLARGGNTQDAVGILQNAVRRYPGNAHLWIGLGNALIDHSRGFTPAAELAYRRAMELQPRYPAPRFFYGLALARSGDWQKALALWREVLATAPPNASWRPIVEQGVAALSATSP